MAWGPDFMAALYGGRYEPRYTLESVAVPTGSGRGSFGGVIRLSSFRAGCGYIPAISRSGSSFSGGVLRLRDWSCSPLTFSVGLMAEAAPAVIRDLRRGQVMVLRVGWNEDPTTFANVALGALTNVVRNKAGWALALRGLEGSLNSRFTDTVGEGAIGHDLASTTISSDYTATDANIFLTGTLNSWRSDGGGLAAMRVTPDSGADFYVTYDPAAVTGVGPYTVPITTAGAFGTTDANATVAGAGGAVSEVIYTNGHPIRCIQRLLTSTGSANYNGAYDVLPYPWALGIDAQHVTTRDADLFVNATQPASGSDAWDMVIDTAQDNPQAWINSWLNGGGYFLTQFKGNLAPRAAVNVANAQTGGHFVLDDSMIAEVLEYHLWDPSLQAEHDGTIITDQSGGTSATAAPDVQSLPMLPDKGHTVGGVYDDTTNRANLRAEVRDRISPYDRNTAEILKLRLRGWWAASAAPGDTVELQISGLIGQDGKPLTGRLAMVTRCSANWFGSDTVIEVARIRIERLTGN